MFRFLPLTLVCLALTLNPRGARGDLVVYNSRPDFLAVTGLTKVADFDNADDFGNNTVVDLQYEFLGLDFNPFNGGVPVTLDNSQLPKFDALSAPNQVQTVPFDTGGGGLEVVFSPPVSAVGMFLGDVELFGSTLTVLNANGQTLTSLDLSAQLDSSSDLQWKFLGVVSTNSDITRIRLAFASTDYVVVDDLEFSRLQITTLTRSGAPVPGGTGVFTTFPQGPTVSTTRAAFLGLGSAGEAGVYLSAIPPTPTVPPNPVKVADLTTDIPGGTGTFTSFSQLATSGMLTSFIGTGSGQAGVYSCDSATPVDPCQLIVDLTTLIPGGMGTFTGFDQLAASNTRTSFIGTGSGQAGVYSCDSAAPTDPCQPLADLFTAIPGGTGTFTSFSDLALAVDVSQPTPPPIHTAFIGSGVGQQGVYLSEVTDVAMPTPPPIKVADLTTAIPGGTGNFTGFSAVSTSLGHTAFLGQGSDDQAGIYLASTLTKVIAVGDTLAGQVVTELRLGKFALDGQRLGFAATFADGSQGVFVFTVPFQFSGFFQPVDNPPAINVAKAGSAIPVKFSLNGNQGLEIFADGYPKSQAIACDSTSPQDGIEETVTAGASSLSYDASTDQYKYVWKTNKAWAQSCRQFIVKLIDGSSHVADFKFTK
jgi:hypothetical protein